jgi:hypothetical protein
VSFALFVVNLPFNLFLSTKTILNAKAQSSPRAVAKPLPLRASRLCVKPLPSAAFSFLPLCTAWGLRSRGQTETFYFRGLLHAAQQGFRRISFRAIKSPQNGHVSVKHTFQPVFPASFRPRPRPTPKSFIDKSLRRRRAISPKSRPLLLSQNPRRKS